MIEAQVGRLLVAAVHQAVADELPMRADFYDHWLRGERLRDGSVGLAPMTAVMGFLRAEGAAYHVVMSRAGEHAAAWTLDSMTAPRRRLLLLLPRWWRCRAVLRLVSRTIREGYSASKVTVRVRRGEARLEIRQSLFCRVREAQDAPQCDFHVALVARLLAAFQLQAVQHVESCAGSGKSACVLTLDFRAAAHEQSVAA